MAKPDSIDGALIESLTRDQEIELDAYMERAKAEYLQKILE
jgi:hypothetical protein